jgi:ribonuclease HII
MPDLSLEADFRAQGYRLIAGVDEAGRGPLAGPVAAAAVILPPDLTGDEPWLAAIDDSKRLSERRRTEAAALIRENFLAGAVELISPEIIDHIGIGLAVIRAMLAAVDRLRPAPHALLMDWVPITECPLPHQTVVKGDGQSLSIAAASILAKVARDELMVRAEGCYPGYGFARHKGYATPGHLRSLSELGPSPIHRRSFSPLRQGRLLSDVDTR